MARKNYVIEEILKYLRKIEIEAGRGDSIEVACRKIGNSQSFLLSLEKNMVVSKSIKLNH